MPARAAEVVPNWGKGMKKFGYLLRVDGRVISRTPTTAHHASDWDCKALDTSLPLNRRPEQMMAVATE